MATTEFSPPEGLTPAMGGVILAESVQPEHKVAWLIEAAIGGAIDLDESGKSVRLVRHPGVGPAEIQAPLDRMFGGRSEITLGEYDPTFAAGWGEVGTQLGHWKQRSGLWDPAGDRKQLGIRLLGGLAAVVGALGVVGASVMAARHGEGWLPGIAVAAAVAAAGFAAAPNRAATANGAIIAAPALPTAAGSPAACLRSRRPRSRGKAQGSPARSPTRTHRGSPGGDRAPRG